MPAKSMQSSNKPTKKKEYIISNELAYSYHDHSKVPCYGSLCVKSYIISQSPTVIRSQKLPAKLDAILSDETFSSIVSWMPHGRSWRILRPKVFTSDVIPKYFEYSNYNSFIRLVNAWGFRRITSGVDQGSYYHELFLRGMPHLFTKMRRLTPNDKKAAVSSENEPDFYRISERFPIPSLDMNINKDRKSKSSTICYKPSFPSFDPKRIGQSLAGDEIDEVKSLTHKECVLDGDIADKIATLTSINAELAKLDYQLGNNSLLRRMQNKYQIPSNRLIFANAIPLRNNVNEIQNQEICWQQQCDLYHRIYQNPVSK